MTPTYINFNKKYKREDRKFLKYKIIAGVASFLILFGGVLYIVVYSSMFHITHISIDNAQLDASLISNLKDFFGNQSRITKFLGADNILVWNANKLTKLEKSPEIAEINFKKDYIERTINISVKLREKFGVWCSFQAQTSADYTQNDTDNNSISENQPVNLRESACWWFDKNGALFAVAPEIEGNAINKVDDFSGRNLKLGDFILNENLTPNLIEIFSILERSGLGIRALELENLAFQEIVFDQPQTSLPKIYFSLRFNPGFTLAAINDLKKTGLQKIDYIDFRVENRAYFKPK